ncbi:recombinase family protein [Pontixanthobacter aestiaquae]|uniref:Recombinase family protein n=1 Tax=Pontixanthobacter aestiaquae TaxID=1509367 RepID=A0A844Z8X5_9SPHN|nr:recombinase family protein [Pontixanthobacter aestiaquae]MDN3644618.1 recombinase family protein [Pontixanthobacter aestiaquae]MXO84375.1 recombinase family protein [Pontixanthobacter aestiaquae]
MTSDTKTMRCAVYTRKSTEEGLDKAFNSLDAQREACEAYILSQQHEGWKALPDLYDDGGFSGGSMERPALCQLLDDVKAGKIDVVVVYKIDRLTRALADFAKIVDVLDQADASFVSVTQAFSTTTSMGRLTLNVLLSFAQFEREVGAERIRDKIAASKAKGMWMGGGVPLGYEAKDRKLQVVPDEAATVCAIMERYLASDSIRTLVEELRDDGYVSKRRVMKDGSVRGGVPFKRGALAYMLSNRIYVGEVVHKDNVYPGEHDAIVSRELFDAVQTKLADRTASNDGTVRRRMSLLAGMIRDDLDRPMSPCHTRNHGRRYSYYASNMNDIASSPALRLPAGELELSVRNTVAAWLRNGDRVRELAAGRSAKDIERLFECCSGLATRLVAAPIAEARTLLEQLALQVSVTSKGASASFELAVLGSMAGLTDIPEKRISITIPTSQSNYGHEPRLRLEPAESGSISRDERLVELVARAFAAREQLLGLDQHQLDALPVTKLRHLQRTARVSYLDPAIIRAILGGTQPSRLSARSIWRMSDLPLDWAGQRQALGVNAAQS